MLLAAVIGLVFLWNFAKPFELRNYNVRIADSKCQLHLFTQHPIGSFATDTLHSFWAIGEAIMIGHDPGKNDLLPTLADVAFVKHVDRNHIFSQFAVWYMRIVIFRLVPVNEIALTLHRKRFPERCLVIDEFAVFGGDMPAIKYFYADFASSGINSRLAQRNVGPLGNMQSIFSRVGGTPSGSSGIFSCHSLLPGVYSQQPRTTQSGIEMCKLGLKLSGGFSGIILHLLQGGIGCLPIMPIHSSLVPTRRSGNGGEDYDAYGQVPIRASQIVRRICRINLALLVGVFGFVSLLLLLPLLFRPSLFFGRKDNGIPWRWALLTFGWFALAQGFIFLIVKGLSG